MSAPFSPSSPPEERLLRLIEQRARAVERERLERSYRAFIEYAWPLIEPGRRLSWNWHLDAIVEYMEAYRRGEIRQLIINIPPRCMKSLTVGVFFHPWVWTTQPHYQFLTLAHEDSLAIRDATKSRRIMQRLEYQALWGHRWRFAGDMNLKSRYENDHNGHRIALGLGGGTVGEGGDFIHIDDPHDAKKAQSEADRLSKLESFDTGVMTRRNDPATSRMCIIMQRLHQRDLTGHVLSKTEGSWELLVIPMEHEPSGFVDLAQGRPVNTRVRDPRTKPGELLWPSRIPAAEVRELKESLGSYGSSGQLQQRPTPAEGAILKRPWWQWWPREKPFPQVVHVVQSWDTAFTDDDVDNAASYSARSTWGVWLDEHNRTHVLLMEAWKARAEYPDLRRTAREAFEDWRPDVVVVEKKASGQSLIQDLKRIRLADGARIPIRAYQPDVDKVARAHAVAPYLEAGYVWIPHRNWVGPFLEECASFPKGESNDWVDTMTQALLYVFRRGWAANGEDGATEPGRRRRRRRKGSPYGRQRAA